MYVISGVKLHLIITFWIHNNNNFFYKKTSCYCFSLECVAQAREVLSDSRILWLFIKLLDQSLIASISVTHKFWLTLFLNDCFVTCYLPYFSWALAVVYLRNMRNNLNKFFRFFSFLLSYFIISKNYSREIDSTLNRINSTWRSNELKGSIVT